MFLYVWIERFWAGEGCEPLDPPSHSHPNSFDIVGIRLSVEILQRNVIDRGQFSMRFLIDDPSISKDRLSPRDSAWSVAMQCSPQTSPKIWLRKSLHHRPGFKKKLHSSVFSLLLYRSGGMQSRGNDHEAKTYASNEMWVDWSDYEVSANTNQMVISESRLNPIRSRY